MTEAPPSPIPPEPTREDVDHVRLLSIFHYVLGGLVGLFALFPLIHVALGVAVMVGAMPADDGGEQMPALVGLIFVVVGGAMVAVGEAIAIAMLLAGGKLRRHEGYTFCQVVAGIACIIVPFGTVLGVFTLLVLNRSSVRTMFGRA